jgi:AraC-like DNA-binding protein
VAALAPEHALCEHDGFQQGVQVNFTPIGARLVFGLPLSELGAVAPLADLLPRRYRDLAERLQDLPDWDRRFDLLDAVLAERLAAARADTAVVSWGVGRIEQAGGVLSVRGLARELGYSHKHVIALFRDQVGVPPKLLARIVRFDRLLRHLRAGGGGGWAELALQFGYYDQPHLAREVRAFTGLRPSEMRPLAAEVLGQLP